MEKTLTLVIAICISCFITQAQEYPSAPSGIPLQSVNTDILPGFLNPPPGYGDVAFYWWQGDSLTRERLTWQLNQLQNKGVSSLQINYSHLDEGGITYGLSNPSKPALFTPEWWDLLRWFATESEKRGMTISLSDYTLGIGQGFSMDDAITENPELNGSELHAMIKDLKGKGSLDLPENLLTLTSLKILPDGSADSKSRTDLLPEVKNNRLDYNFGGETRKITAVYFQTLIPSYDPMHPESGKAYCHHFFGRFERELPPETFKKAVNFFFSDELNFRVTGNLWNRFFAGEFKKRKGYDIVPFLDALYTHIGKITPKIRIDYNDVLVSLSEENFFKPVYQWHEDRGLIFGCDHGGRGRDVAEFGDYFRTQRWNQGPGSDQPRLGKDVTKAKVAASIAHMYQRPRVWLEGFYGSGWGTSSAQITDAIYANFVLGYNLLSFHGLYYSTMGGWWEWAPPCNHFRMPYWKQIDPLMKSVERLSYTLSQGVHHCDVAIIYPTEPVVAGIDGQQSVKTAFAAGNTLYENGIDFDFIDYESLARAEVQNGELHVSGEKFRVLVIPSMKVIRHASLLKIKKFIDAGGIVANLGETPETTELSGSEDSGVIRLISGIFENSTKMIQCNHETTLLDAISGKYIPDFKILAETVNQPYVMHRIAGNRHIYAVYNLPVGTRCFFKAKGYPELWNPSTGEIFSLSRSAVSSGEGTEIILPLTETEMQLIVFSDTPSSAKEFTRLPPVKTIPVEGKWEFELRPSLDNQWGDFQLPATREIMGAQVRQLYYSENENHTNQRITTDSTLTLQTCGYGKQFLKLGPLPDLPDEQVIQQLEPARTGESLVWNNKTYHWSEYGFSWRYGVEGDYGHQGYHGLKGKMYDDFIRLGKLAEQKHSLKRVPEPEGNYYILSSQVIAPGNGEYEMLTGNTKPFLLYVGRKKTDTSSGIVFLKKGENRITAVYNKACETHIIFRSKNTLRISPQPVSMKWYQDDAILPFDYKGTDQSSGIFSFTSAPGLKNLAFSAYGKMEVQTDGKVQPCVITGKEPDGLTHYQVTLSNLVPDPAEVQIKVDFQPGYRGMAAFPGYIRQICGTGRIALGDWSEIHGLKAYSGGALYRKKISLTPEDLKNKLVISLGDLVSSAELFINGESAGIRLAPPWDFDITRNAKPGENLIEAVVYNTLGNHYTTIPTRYRGSIKSGISGPVSLIVY